jgi:hypothetical protein
LEQVHSIYAERDPHLHLSRAAVIRIDRITALEAFLKSSITSFVGDGAFDYTISHFAFPLNRNLGQQDSNGMMDLPPRPGFLLSGKTNKACPKGHLYPKMRLWIGGKPTCEICYDAANERSVAAYQRKMDLRQEQMADTPNFMGHVLRYDKPVSRKKAIRLYAEIPEGWQYSSRRK